MKVIILNNKTKEKGRNTEEMDPMKVLKSIDFAGDLLKDFTGKIDEYAKENKIDPLTLLNIMQAVLDSEKGD